MYWFFSIVSDWLFLSDILWLFSPDANKGLKNDIQELNSYLISIETINNDYTNIFNNIMNPIKTESEKGLKATFRTAILSIIISTIISIIIQNWNFLYFKIF